jgi:hypothetical protein
MGVVEMMPTIEDLVDQLGPIEQSLDTPEVAQWKAAEKKAAALRKLIGERIKIGPDQTAHVYGNKYSAVIGPRENKTSIVSLAKVYAIAKKAAFLEACGLTLKALEELIPDARVRAGLLKVERTGSRPVETYPILAASAAAGMQKAA